MDWILLMVIAVIAIIFVYKLTEHIVKKEMEKSIPKQVQEVREEIMKLKDLLYGDEEVENER